MNIRKSVKELAELTGLGEKQVKRVLEIGVEIGSIKKISEDIYEMTDMGSLISKKVNLGNMFSVDPGSWKCSKCKIINNALNGKKCIKCGYDFMDSMASEILHREQKPKKFPLVTDREMLIFLTGHVTGMGLTLPRPKGVSFRQKMDYQFHVSGVMAEITIKLLDEFPHIKQEEFDEILIQLNALKTMPIFEDAIKKLSRVKY